MAYLTKLHQKDLYSSKINTLIDLHLSLHNYVEAALATLLLADEYEWSKPDQNSHELPSKNSKQLSIAFESPSKTKERFYHKAIHYLGEGKYWELGIGLLKELRKFNINLIKTQQENLETEHSYYINIRSKDRFFESYFLVDFIGDFPGTYKVGYYFMKQNQFD